MHWCTLLTPRKLLFTASCAVRARSTYRSSTTCSATEIVHKAPTAAYVHLPFCKRRCFYCDFPIQVVGNRVEGDVALTRFEDYINVLLKEIHSTSQLNDRPLSTVFFGGGTPSLVPPPLLERIISKLHNHFGIDPDAEISIEADPGTFDATKLRQYKALGVNRFSIGVQAFDQDLLECCGRAHTLDDVYRAVQAVHDASVTNWSLDLISGLPHLTPEKWRHGLRETIKLKPPHISVYDLQIEDKTPFSRRYTPGTAPLPTNEDAAAMYREASEQLRAHGYVHYEVSNYALPGYECKHNQVYWQGNPYYAFGVGAASYSMGRRFTRPRRLQDYVSWVDEYSSSAPGFPASDLPMESPEDVLLETVMLQLRLATGLDMEALEKKFGTMTAQSVMKALQAHVDRGLVMEEGSGVDGAPARVRLTDPEGFLVSNDVISDVFSAVSL